MFVLNSNKLRHMNQEMKTAKASLKNSMNFFLTLIASRSVPTQRMLLGIRDDVVEDLTSYKRPNFMPKFCPKQLPRFAKICQLVCIGYWKRISRCHARHKGKITLSGFAPAEVQIGHASNGFDDVTWQVA